MTRKLVVYIPHLVLLRYWDERSFGGLAM